MKKQPFFSIVIPTFNRASKLQFTLFCIFRQSFSDFEIIISDNCSIDNTEEIVNKLRNKKIHYYKTKKTVIYPQNIKNALKHAKGRYIFIHSDDDVLLYNNSLMEIYEKIKEYKVGYVRPKYVCMSADGKQVFRFKIAQPQDKNQYLPPNAGNETILSFLNNTDLYFITGIIYKNVLPIDIKMLNSEHAPWIKILFYAIKNFGAYYIGRPHIVASWSQWRLKHNPVYELSNGRLESEQYFNIIKKKIKREAYERFLRNQLKTMYVFPFIKAMVGNKKMLKVASRVIFLDPSMKKSITYWINLGVALFLPRSILILLKNIFRYLYMQFFTVADNKQIATAFEDLKLKYLHSIKLQLFSNDNNIGSKRGDIAKHFVNKQ